MSDNCSVKVAVRVRPLVQSEISKGCQDIIDVIEENEQIIIRSIEREDKAFTFNYVLSSQASQCELYDRCVQPLIDNLFKGYNVTILAYGQTGSGKTHSMGTCYSGEGEMGVIPRAVHEIYKMITDNFSYNFSITVSFMELYQEVLYDLLSGKSRDQCILEMREDGLKGIHIPRLTEVPVKSSEDILNALQQGSQGRATGATAMNLQSSRSHAVFTINISMINKNNCKEHKQAKLHLVDLAGSERSKKTGAVGTTFKEGVNINKGLLALGNVISCLGDEKQQNGFIPYRDSNLTRLLKDSLGGNSITLMIACVSPADYNIDETLSTLRYADRARKIKNKPIVNQDVKLAEINELKKTIQQLRLQIVGQGGPMICPAEIELLKKEIIDLKQKIRDLTCQLSMALVDKTNLHEKLLILQNNNEALSKKLLEIQEEYEATFNKIDLAVKNGDLQIIKDSFYKLQNIQMQFVELGKEQKRADEEIQSHENSCNKLLINELESSNELDENHTNHTNRQMNLNMQLTKIQKELILKEGLAKQLLTNNQYIVDYEAMAENEVKITNLQKEKEELIQMLKKAGHTDKFSDERKKRVQELEQQISVLNRKIQEQGRLIKLKAKDEEKIAKLNQEILQMKQMKVKLVKTMREESDKFRHWKLQKERECQRLKQQDLKKENEITRMKVIHSKQQIVFKRRVEQAEALNKRLKNVLAMRQKIQETKNSGKVEKIESWLRQEYDLFINIVELKATLKELLDDRAALQEQLDGLKSNLEVVDLEACKGIEEELELRSVQIQDLQQKILDTDDDKGKTRFDRFQSMGEAKFGLKFLLDKIVESHTEKVQIRSKLQEQKESVKEVQEKLKTIDQEQFKLEEMRVEEITQVHKEYEEKIAILLRQIRDTNETSDQSQEYQKTFSIQQEQLELQESIINDLQKKNFELEEKIKAIELAQKHKFDVQTPQRIQIKANDKENEPEINYKENIKMSKTDANYITVKENEEDIPVNEISFIEDSDDIKNDPDWKKTPLGKRILEKKHNPEKTTTLFHNGAVKRSSDGGCTCRTDCTKSRCGCNKLNRECSAKCRCNPEVCLNRQQDHDSALETEDGDSFKKPKIDENVNLHRRIGRTRQLFQLQHSD